MAIEIKFDAKAMEGKPLRHYWSECVGAGRAHEGLRANWQEQLKLVVKECGFRYIRFHGLFHDDMCVYREKDGVAIYNWQYIDELFDRLLDTGIRPFVELGFFPKDIAAPHSRTQFWWKGCITPPDSFDKWVLLVGKFTRHCVERYGLDEVRQWYFEVWNEPNLDRGFWDGTRSRYFELYRVSVQAIKAVDSRLCVGGPATSNFVPDDRFDCEREDRSRHITHQMKDLSQGEWKAPWMEAFLEFCSTEGLPVDFISTHPYPTDFPLDEGGQYVGRTRPAGSTAQDLQWLRKVVNESAFPSAEIHLTEWSSSPSPRDHAHDSLPAAAFVVRANIEAAGLVNSLSYWTFTDVFEESAAGDTIFHGGFGMINFQGIVKPVYHAYRFLNALGDEEITKGQGYVATRCSTSGFMRLLAWNYPEEVTDAVPLALTSEAAEATLRMGGEQTFRVAIQGLQPGATFTVDILDEHHGMALTAWKAMGSPEPPNRQQIKQLQESGVSLDWETIEADANGALLWQRTLLPWTVLLMVQCHRV